MTTIRDIANDGRYDKSLRAAAGRLTQMGYGNVGIKSGYRSRSQNRKAGGATDSQHIHARALDIAGASSWSKQKRAEFFSAAAQAGFKGFGAYSTGAIHIDTRPGAPSFWGVPGPGNRKGHKRNNKANFNEFPAELRGIFQAVAQGKAYAPRPQVDVPNVAVAQAPDPQTVQAAAAWEAAPALAPRAEPISPYAAPAALAPTASPGLAALAAIESIAPTGPSQTIVGQVADMSRYAPESPATPDYAMAPANGGLTNSAIGIYSAPALDTSFGGINPDSLMGSQTFPGVSLPATPTGPTGAETLFAKAQAPAGFFDQPALAPAPTQQPDGLQAALSSMPQTATPMGLQPPGTEALPKANVPAEVPLTQLPALAPPMEIQEMPVAEVASPEEQTAAAWQAAPSLSVADVYGGQIGTAAATDGNFVSRDPFGITSVTNKYGVTTGMTPDGKQTAYGAGPNLGNLGGALGSVFTGLGANRNKIAGQVVGALVGGALLGPAGALAGGYFGGKMGARNDFPGKPEGGTQKHVDKGGWNGTGRSERDARGEWGDRAVDHVSRGGGMTGLW